MREAKLVALEASKLAAKTKEEAQEESEDEDFLEEGEGGESSSGSDTSDEEGAKIVGVKRKRTGRGDSEGGKKDRVKHRSEDVVDKSELLGLHADAADILGERAEQVIEGEREKISKKRKRDPKEEAAHKAHMDTLMDSLLEEDRVRGRVLGAPTAPFLLARLNSMQGSGDASFTPITGANTKGIAQGKATSVEVLVASSYGSLVQRGNESGIASRVPGSQLSCIPGLSAFTGGSCSEDGALVVNASSRKTKEGVDREQLLSIATSARAIAGGTKVAVQETVKFAGKRMTVTKIVDRSAVQPSGVDGAISSGASSSGGGLATVLSQLNAPENLSTLTKTSLDWDGYKAREGLDEDFTAAARSGGVVEKAALLQRLDERSHAVDSAQRAAEKRAKDIQAAAGRL